MFMRLQKVLHGALSVVFFLLCLQAASFLARTLWLEQGICNEQGPFGALAPIWGLWGVFVVASLFFLWQWWQEQDTKQGLLWLLLLSAGGSNALERLTNGCIFDFLTLPFFPLFNLADVFLTISVVFLLWKELQRKK